MTPRLSRLPVNYTAGIFLFEEEQRSFLGATSDRVNGNWLGQEFNTRTLSESSAIYFDGTYDLADDMRLTAGYRATDEEIERYGVNGVFSIALGGCNNAQYCSDSIAGNAAGTNRPEGFSHWGSMWGDVGTTRFGTQGFEFSKFNRTIYNPDTNGDGPLTGDERVAWMLDGVARWEAIMSKFLLQACNWKVIGGTRIAMPMSVLRGAIQLWVVALTPTQQSGKMRMVI